MVDQARELKVPLMAGSSLPVTWRLPPLEIPLGRSFQEVLVASRGNLEYSSASTRSKRSSAWPSGAIAWVKLKA